MSDQRSDLRPFGLLTFLSPLVWWVRLWQTNRTSISAVEKFTRAALMVPAFAGIFILLRLRLRLRGPIEVDVDTTHGDRFHCHPPDLIQMYLWLFGIWEPDVTHYIRRHLKPGDVFIDVGANIGYDTVLAARCVGEGGRVVAIEASPIVFAALQETIAINPTCVNVRAINKAAAAPDGPGMIEVFSGPQHNIGLTTTVAGHGRQGTVAPVRIAALPLDDLLSSDETRRSRLIKIDVEGAEDQVLAGMTSVIRNGRHDLEILVELSPNWWSDPAKRPIDVLQPFLDAGFHVYAMENNYWPWRYLWPNCVKRPQLLDPEALQHRVDRLDVVLSRSNAPEL